MSEHDDRMAELEARIARVEGMVEELLRVRRGGRPEPAARPAPPRTTEGADAPGGAEAQHPPRTHARPARRTADDWMRLGEDWLGRVGIVLLLLGLAFLGASWSRARAGRGCSRRPGARAGPRRRGSTWSPRTSRCSGGWRGC